MALIELNAAPPNIASALMVGSTVYPLPASIADGALLSRSGAALAGVGPGTVSGNTVANTSGTFQNTVRNWGLANTSVVGLALQDTTPAEDTPGVTRNYSPILVIGGTARKTNSPAASHTVRIGLQTHTVAGAAAVGWEFRTLVSINEGAWSTTGMPYISSNGITHIPILYCATGLSSPNMACTGDAGSGTASQVKLTNATVAAGSGADATMIKPPAAVAQAGWLKLWVGTDAVVVPYWHAD